MSEVTTGLMLYMSAQNELSEAAESNIDAIKSCASGGNKLNNICTYILLDSFAKTDAKTRKTTQYLLPPGATETDFVAKPIVLNGVTYVNKEVTTETAFNNILHLAYEHFAAHSPARKILIFWGHGGGMKMLDEGSKHAQTTIAEFAGVLDEWAMARGEHLRFDTVAFDSCYMCMIETMHELRRATSYALCSSTVVASSGYPYKDIVTSLEADGPRTTVSATALKIADLYDKAYKRFDDRFLICCDMNKIELCARELNVLGELLMPVLERKKGSFSVRDAIGSALIMANEEYSYVYVLWFLRALSKKLPSAGLSTSELQTLNGQVDKLAAAVRSAFQGKIGDTSRNPVSPQIWAPSAKVSFQKHEAIYNALESSDKGKAGWVSMWRKYHGQDAISPSSGSKFDVLKMGLPHAV